MWHCQSFLALLRAIARRLTQDRAEHGLDILHRFRREQPLAFVRLIRLAVQNDPPQLAAIDDVTRSLGIIWNFLDIDTTNMIQYILELESEDGTEVILGARWNVAHIEAASALGEIPAADGGLERHHRIASAIVMLAMSHLGSNLARQLIKHLRDAGYRRFAKAPRAVALPNDLDTNSLRFTKDLRRRVPIVGNGTQFNRQAAQDCLQLGCQFAAEDGPIGEGHIVQIEVFQ